MSGIQPYILGSGAASKAIQNSLSVLDVLHPDWGIRKPILLKRNTKLSDLKPNNEAVLFLANPHALHAPGLLEAQEAGFSWLISEKPSAVSLDQVSLLKQIKIPVAVCHGYRQTWAIQKIKQMLSNGELGSWITIEGRYWQSSAAQKKLSGNFQKNWKDNQSLSGDFDVLLDLGTHWVDLVMFLAGENPTGGSVWRSYANSDVAHRDTYNMILMEFSENRRSFASVSKTVHGSGNDLEIHVIGEKKSISWKFLNPDELVIGEGNQKNTLNRPDDSLLGSQQYPFHGMGWLEGYIEIIKQYFMQMRGEKYTPYPNLNDQIRNLEFLFKQAK
ncbi:MAG: gfo/Idh/MocA family oxidoreductase [Proteobacteria bacterium]|nr:gfo/Idh/MocA family oxidoreductase [Pseudomonadota bacterium]NDD04627.1 gfo/Idh/MocA family oxidoreductase [Pseudomonadota bacterium]NDG27943.1 gfo/Idh/MocA family oxidoreductase [Pseudomonadota bacterium]